MKSQRLDLNHFVQTQMDLMRQAARHLSPDDQRYLVTTLRTEAILMEQGATLVERYLATKEAQ